MAEFTKEQLIEKLERRLAVTTHYPDFEEAQLDAQIFKIALEALTAGMEQEPVAWLLSGGGAKNNVSFDSGNAYADPLREVTPLYTAPPAPVSVPECFKRLLHHAYGMTMGHDWNKGTMAGHHRAKLCQAVDECRAAMLQGADGTLTNEGTMQLSGNSEQIEPVSNRDELPLDYLQGHKDGLEWAAQLAEANHPQTGDWLYDDPIDLARAIRKGPDMPTVQAGNSPVTPDGWISCSEQMPSAGEQVLAYRPDAPESNDPLIKMATYVGGSAHGHGFDCYCKPTHWMPLPAAPQEVNRG